MRRPPGDEILQMARELGVDVDNERIRGLLREREVSAAEAGEILDRSRQSMYEAMAADRVEGVIHRRNGKKVIPYASPYHLLVWASNRPERHRYVNEERARRYAQERNGGPGPPVEE